MSSFPFPEFIRLDYILQEDPRWYQQSVCPPGFNRLPVELTVEEKQDHNIQAPKVIRGRIRGKEYTFFTGIRPTPDPLVHYGDHYTGRGKKSLILFRFSENSRSFAVYYFRSFHCSGKKRDNFIREFILRLNNGVLN